jgi:hypothetical protein
MRFSRQGLYGLWTKVEVLCLPGLELPGDALGKDHAKKEALLEGFR